MADNDQSEKPGLASTIDTRRVNFYHVFMTAVHDPLVARAPSGTLWQAVTDRSAELPNVPGVTDEQRKAYKEIVVKEAARSVDRVIP